MKKETKSEVKKNVATGASTAAGATAGVILGAAVSSDSAEAAISADTADIVSPDEPQPSTEIPTSQQQSAMSATVTSVQTETNNPVNPEITEPAILQSEPEIEVISYDATSAEGTESLMCDANQDGAISDGGTEILQDQEIAVEPLQDEAVLGSQFTQDELPDYVNDANVDIYLA